MELSSIQIANEYSYDKTHTVETIRSNYSNFEPEVQKYIALVEEYFSQTDFSYVLKNGTKKNWDSKQERFEFMRDMDLEDICWEVVVWSTIKPMVTFTEVVGKLFKKLAVSTDRQGIETSADLIALLNKTPCIEVIYPRDSEEGVMMVKSNINLDKDMQTYLDNQRFTLPSLVPPLVVETNSCSGYETVKGSLVLGGNHHDKPICLDHINRMNSIAFSLEPRVLKQAEPGFKAKNETALENQKRYAAFKQNNVEGVSIYAKLIHQGNKFYLTNRFDTRGRSYAHGYHCSTQGDNYRKSMLILANKEIVEM